MDECSAAVHNSARKLRKLREENRTHFSPSMLYVSRFLIFSFSRLSFVFFRPVFSFTHTSKANQNEGKRSRCIFRSEKITVAISKLMDTVRIIVFFSPFLKSTATTDSGWKLKENGLKRFFFFSLSLLFDALSLNICRWLFSAFVLLWELRRDAYFDYVIPYTFL